MTDSQQFRADGHAAVDWAADYLEGIGERHVMSTVEPGEIRAGLPASPPEEAEPFADVLADLDRVLLPGITHWNHPRFFAYFGDHGVAPRHPRRAARGDDERERHALEDVAGRDGARGAHALVARSAARPPADVARPHRGHGFDLDARGAVRGAHGAARSPRRRRLRARALLGRPRLPHPRPRDPPRPGRRRLPHAHRRARPERRVRGRRDRRDDVDDVGRPRARDRRRRRGDAAPGCTSTPPTPARRASAPSSARRASSAPTRSS